MYAVDLKWLSEKLSTVTLIVNHFWCVQGICAGGVSCIHVYDGMKNWRNLKDKQVDSTYKLSDFMLKWTQPGLLITNLNDDSDFVDFVWIKKQAAACWWSEAPVKIRKYLRDLRIKLNSSAFLHSK